MANKLWVFFVLVVILPFMTDVAKAQQQQATSGQRQDEIASLQKQVQNPVADLISLPFQNNLNFNMGSKDRMVYNLNVQPIIPFRLNADWMLITRTIIPIINQPSLFPGTDDAAGVGDINPTFFFASAKPSEWIWGVGPTLTLPTATDSALGSHKWSAGPAVVLARMHDPWVYGVIANNQWSFAGWGDRKVNQLLIQPFVNYNLPKGWYICSSPMITSNWEADTGDKWTVPLGGGGGRLFKIGKLPVNAQLQAFGNVIRPEFGSDWQLRFQIQLLFPK